jgi:hypothetical protein
MFPEGSLDITFQPLSYKILIHEVILREAAVLLIQQDLDFDRAQAMRTLICSQGFGTMLHPGDNSSHVQAAIDKTTRSAQRQETLLRLWKSSDSIESFKDWVQAQNFKDNDAHIKVLQIKDEIKEEEKETGLPAEGSSGNVGMEVMGF